MSPSQKMLLLFIGLPLLEMYLLIQVGSHIGALVTVMLVIFTAVLGAYLVRLQGFATLQKVQAEMANGTVPAGAMMEGVALLVAGVLLLTPGFLTDTLGFLLLTPPIRKSLLEVLLRNVVVMGEVNPRPAPQDPHTLEGEYWKEGDEPPKR